MQRLWLGVNTGVEEIGCTEENIKKIQSRSYEAGVLTVVAFGVNAKTKLYRCMLTCVTIFF